MREVTSIDTRGYYNTSIVDVHTYFQAGWDGAEGGADLVPHADRDQRLPGLRVLVGNPGPARPPRAGPSHPRLTHHYLQGIDSDKSTGRDIFLCQFMHMNYTYYTKEKINQGLRYTLCDIRRKSKKNILWVEVWQNNVDVRKVNEEVGQ